MQAESKLSGSVQGNQGLKEAPSPFSYRLTEEAEKNRVTVERIASFDVASTDRDVLQKVNNILQRQGYIALGDGAGRQHYLVDGRRNLYKAAHNIQDLSKQSYESLLPQRNYDDHILREAIDQVLAEAGVQRQLRGFQVLRYILQLIVPDETIMRPLKKSLYPRVGEYFHMSVEQIDRVLRYCLARCGWSKGNSAFISAVRDDTIRRYEALEGEYSGV